MKSKIKIAIVCLLASLMAGCELVSYAHVEIKNETESELSNIELTFAGTRRATSTIRVNQKFTFRFIYFGDGPAYVTFEILGEERRVNIDEYIIPHVNYRCRVILSDFENYSECQY